MALSLQQLFENFQENALKCSKLIHFWTTTTKNEFKPECLGVHATMQRDVLLHFWVIFFKMRWKYENCKLLTRSTALLVALYLSKLDGKTVRG